MPRPMSYQLAANLIAAAGARLTEVRITRLVDGVYYAVAVVAAQGGVVEVDARPSDALNLAVVTGAPVRVDAAVLSNPEVNPHTDWEQYPARVPDLAAEERQRRADFLRTSCPGGHVIQDAPGRPARPRQHLDAGRMFVRSHGLDLSGRGRLSRHGSRRRHPASPASRPRK